MDRLKNFVEKYYREEASQILGYFPTQTIDPRMIRAVMINEVAAKKPIEDFYSLEEKSEYVQSAVAIFQQAEVKVQTIDDILNLGIYITNAIKLPKTASTISNERIEYFLPILKTELELFPNVKVIMLMGDVARKSFNMIAKANTKKNALPSGSTYKLRHKEWYYQGIRILPAYILTGKNLKIERSKSIMSAEEVRKMLEIIHS
ncbi:uracil-DNA glycosylase [Enterococcus sp. AZ109]|uniref:uracil-DNA glycosylase n=1 Tax=Enterococcus sp. AZ109 TaxID=2774634 RepID=UPI003F289691